MDSNRSKRCDSVRQGGAVLVEFALVCLALYVLIAAGIELSQAGHIRFTELCQCTRSQTIDCGSEIASVDLEVLTVPAQTPPRVAPSQGA